MRDVGADRVIVLDGVARVDDGIPDVGEALGHDQRRSGRLGACRGIGEAERLGRVAREALVQQDVVLEKADVRGHDRLRGERVCLGQAAEMRVRVIAHGEAGNVRAQLGVGALELERGIAVARAQGVSRAQQPVGLRTALVAVVAAGVGGLSQVRVFRCVRRGKEREVLRRDGADAAGEVVAIRRPGGICEDRRIGRKVAVALGHGRHDHAVRDVLGIAHAFVVGKEVSAVMHDRAAGRHAVLVLPETLLAWSEVVVRIQRIVAQEVIQRAVQPVGSRARDDSGNAAICAAKLGRCGCGQDAELRDRVGRRTKRVARVEAIDIAHAIDEKVVRLRPLPVHFIVLAGAAEATHHHEACRSRPHAGLQDAQLREVASAERQGANLAIADDRALRDLIRLQASGLRGNLDGLLR